VLCVIPVDRLLAVLNDRHDGIVMPTAEPLLVDRQRPPYCVKEARRVHEIFIGTAAIWMPDFDEVIHVAILGE